MRLLANILNFEISGTMFGNGRNQFDIFHHFTLSISEAEDICPAPPSLCSLVFSRSYLHSSHEIVLRRSHPGSWGFSIVGGYEESHSNQAFFIKTIVLGTPAYYDGRLK